MFISHMYFFLLEMSLQLINPFINGMILVLEGILGILYRLQVLILFWNLFTVMNKFCVCVCVCVCVWRDFFKLGIFFIYISNAIPFPSFLAESPLYPSPHPAHPTYPLPLPGPGVPLYWGI
jgi:hypothetical protein